MQRHSPLDQSENLIVEAAVVQLGAFGGELSREQAHALLRLWRFYDEPTEGETASILRYFPVPVSGYMSGSMGAAEHPLDEVDWNVLPSVDAGLPDRPTSSG